MEEREKMSPGQLEAATKNERNSKTDSRSCMDGSEETSVLAADEGGEVEVSVVRG